MYYPTGKRRKTRIDDLPKEIVGDRETGIDDLPEEIIDIILSFLPAKSALSTRFLSKTWNLRGTKLAALDFDELSWKDVGLKFDEFVNMVLLNHSTESIHKFSLRAGRSINPSDVSNWIDIVIGRNIRVLNLHLIKACSVNLPESFYCCGTLEVVILKGSFCLPEPSHDQVCCLPKLTVLEFHVDYESNESFRKLISACPRLQSLKFSRNGYASVYAIFLPTCKGLEVHFEGIIGLCSEFIKTIRIAMDPGLISDSFGNGINELAKSFHGLQVLELDLSRVPKGCLRRPICQFSTITKLVVKFKVSQWRFVMDLLSCCNNLQVLDLKRSHGKRKKCPLPAVPRCISSSLRSVTFRKFSDASQKEMQMVQFLLKQLSPSCKSSFD